MCVRERVRDPETERTRKCLGWGTTAEPSPRLTTLLLRCVVLGLLSKPSEPLLLRLVRHHLCPHERLARLTSWLPPTWLLSSLKVGVQVKVAPGLKGASTAGHPPISMLSPLSLALFFHPPEGPTTQQSLPVPERGRNYLFVHLCAHLSLCLLFGWFGLDSNGCSGAPASDGGSDTSFYLSAPPWVYLERMGEETVPPSLGPVRMK